MAKQMTQIKSCSVTECSYNKHNSCHTLAITVGGPEPCPQCDTYLHGARKGGIPDMQAGVGACKVSGCSHNSDLECTAGSIMVGIHNNHPDCMTFAAR
jgi:hypothetical protein